MVIALIFVAIALVAPAIASSGYGLPFIQPFERRGTVPIAPFSYGSTTGPLNWHNINETYFLCGNGTNQSPILLDSSSTISPAGSVLLNIPLAHNVVFENLGTTAEVLISGSLYAGNASWNLAQFHFHTPSEHRVDLGHADAEMHLVFMAADGSAKIAVLAFFVEASSQQSTPVLESVFSHLSDIATPGTTTNVTEVDFTSFQQHANSLRYYHYIGSLTAPPCTEGVSWYLATTPIPLRLETFARLKNVTKTNNRYTQNAIGQQNLLEVAAVGL
jgi:carbonic anhydrase